MLGEQFSGARLSGFCVSPKTWQAPREMQRETPLMTDDIAFLVMVRMILIEPWLPRLIGRKQPRWLMGWRRNRTAYAMSVIVIAGVFPKVGVGIVEHLSLGLIVRPLSIHQPLGSAVHL